MNYTIYMENRMKDAKKKFELQKAQKKALAQQKEITYEVTQDSNEDGQQEQTEDSFVYLDQKDIDMTIDNGNFKIELTSSPEENPA